MSESGRERVGKREELRPFESLDVGHFYLDGEYRVLEISEASATLLDSSPAELISKKFCETFGPAEAIFKESIEGRTQLAEFRLPRGGTCNACVRVKHRESASGAGYDVVFCKETPHFKCFNGESVHYREVLGKCDISQKHNDFLENIFAGAGHDLKTPIGVVLGYCELIFKSKSSGTPFDLDRSLKTIYRNCSWIADMVEKLEEFSGIVNRGKAENRERMDLHKELHDVVRRLSKSAFSQQVSMEIRQADKVEVFISPTLLSAILDELVKNAIFYCRKGREISVSLLGLKDGVRITLEVPALEDEVPPLSHLADKLFPHSPDPRQEEATRKPFCLGLGSVKHLAMIADGSLAVRRREPEGETLVLELPAFSG